MRIGELIVISSLLACNSDGQAIPMATVDMAPPLCSGATPTMPMPATIPSLFSMVATDPSWMLGGAFEGKEVRIDETTKPSGTLIVTSVFPDAIVVGDTSAMYSDAMGPSLSGFNHLYIKMSDTMGITPGRVVTDIRGVLTHDVGFPKLLSCGVESTTISNAVPAPLPFNLGSLTDPGDVSNPAKMFAIEAQTVNTVARICPVDTTVPDWIKYNTFQLVVEGNQCGAFDPGVGVRLPSKTFGDFDPLKHQGGTINITGMWRFSVGQNEATEPPTDCTTTDDCAKGAATNGALAGTTCVEGSCKKGGYAFWTINPRTPADIQIVK